MALPPVCKEETLTPVRYTLTSAYPTGLSDSLPSAHLNVTLLAAGAATMGDPRVLWPLCVPVCPARIKWFSSSSSRARNEHEEGGDWTAVTLQVERNHRREEEVHN